MKHPQPAKPFCDSQATLRIIADPVYHEQTKTKHLEIACDIVQEWIQSRAKVIAHILSASLFIDLFTKNQ